MSKAEADLAALRTTVETISSLIIQLRAAVKSGSNDATSNNDKTAPPNTKADLNVLDLAYDAASLIKAHSTKLSLLIINEPFTPTAICTVLRELASGPLPALATAIEQCDAAAYTKIMRSEMQWRVDKIFSEFGVLVKEVPLSGKILTRDQKNGTGATAGKGSLASTGVVWQACDSLMELQKTGIAGLVIQKAEQYRDTLKDALEELQEWAEETSDDEEEDDDIDDAQAVVDAIFGGQRHIPEDDTQKIRERLESSLRRMRMVTLMYQAVIKRRFKTLPALPHPPLPPELASDDPGIVQCLDEVMTVLKKIPDIADELASAFYELNTGDIDKRMDECFFTGFAAAELLVLNWEGQKDEFTVWVSAFIPLKDYY
jgi:hypothetical protein